MEPTRIIAVRHGETAWNVDARIQGQLDVGLNETGRWQARRVGEALAGEAISAVYTSDLGRAHQTAQSIGEVTGVPVVPDEGLRERSFGIFEGKTFTEIGRYVFSLGKEEQHAYPFAPAEARYVRLTYLDHHDEKATFPVFYAFTTDVQVFGPTAK